MTQNWPILALLSAALVSSNSPGICAGSKGNSASAKPAKAKQGAKSSHVPTPSYTYELDGKKITADEAKGYQAYTRSVQLIDKQDIKGAKSALEVAVKYFPSCTEAHLNMSIVLFKLGEYKRSMEEAEKCVQLDPSFADGWHCVGTSGMMIGNNSRALQCFKKYLELAPGGKNAGSARQYIKSLEEKIGAPKLSEAASLVSPSNENYLSECVAQHCIRWDKSSMPLTVYIKGGDQVPGYRPEFDTALRNAFHLWADASPNVISFKFVDTPKDARITCTWTNSREKLVSSIEGGQAVIIPDESAGKISKAEITMVTVDLQGRPVTSSSYIERIAVHEVGHALGLDHSKEQGDAMYQFVAYSTELSKLSERDKKTLLLLYGEEGDRVSAEANRSSANWDVLYKSAEEEYHNGKYRESLKLLQDALTLTDSDKTDPLDHRRTTYSAMAQAYMKLNDMAEAEKMWKLSLVELRKRAQEPHSEYTDVYHSIAVCCSAQKKRAESLSFFKLELAQMDKLHISNSPERVKVLKLLAVSNMADGNFEDALKLYTQLVSLVDSGAIKDKSLTISILRGYADALQARNKPGRANEVDKRIKALQSKK
ncbi:MAG: matrixin family metalloprotease [Candidatus Obscuribacterales bacterium]|nr:matrixin family metalloprotease [Candidatus Obscuribacterales bacterium]